MLCWLSRQQGYKIDCGEVDGAIESYARYVVNFIED